MRSCVAFEELELGLVFNCKFSVCKKNRRSIMIGLHQANPVVKKIDQTLVKIDSTDCHYKYTKNTQEC